MLELVSGTCELEDAALLFRANDASTPLDRIFFTVLDDPPEDGNEASLHSFWDDNIRKVLHVLVPNGRSIRNCINDATVRDLRPDYAFIVGTLCVFRGEEAGVGSYIDTKAILARKMEWTYDPAPYVFGMSFQNSTTVTLIELRIEGYYSAGPELTLVVITSPPRRGSRPIIHDLAHTNLTFRRDRIRNIRHLINLARLFPTLADMVQAPRAEFEPHDMHVFTSHHMHPQSDGLFFHIRGGCTIELAGRHVIKAYQYPGAQERVAKLVNTYELLRTKGVPNTDRLECSSEKKMILSPRGIDYIPKTEQELLDAVVCVLEALEVSILNLPGEETNRKRDPRQVLHQEPVLFHRDIRWHNVIRRLDQPRKWFLIDWEYASKAPTKAADLSKNEHSPRSLSDGHGSEVDLWGVGFLVLESGVACLSTELRSLGEWMQSEHPPSAKEALQKILIYQLSRGWSSLCPCDHP